MYQRFNQSNNISDFIKALLVQTNIPMIPFSKEDLTGQHYIKNKYIYYNKKLIEPYIFGKEYIGLTTKYNSNNSYYDSTTHYYLGEFLRSVKNYYDLNLMPFYNCFNNTFVKDIMLSRSGSSINYSIVSSNEEYQELIIPIKFDTDYTVAIDCPSPLLMRAIFYGNKGLVEKETLDNASNRLKSSGLYKTYSYFKQPFIYRINKPTVSSTEVDLSYYERFLKLIIQLPKNLKYSIVILEGNYIRNNQSSKLVYNNGLIETFSKDGLVTYIPISKPDDMEEEYYNEATLSKLSLLQIPTTYPIAFSDRLIEYLFNNPIVKDDLIDDNIKRVQDYVSSNINRAKNGSILSPTSYTKGIWNDSLRNYIYNLMISTRFNNKAKVDLNGYVDKDTETIITRGQRV